MGKRLQLRRNIEIWLITRLVFVTTFLVMAGAAQAMPQEKIGAEIRQAGRQLILEMTNESGEGSLTGSLQIVLALGSETEMREIGQATLPVPRQPLSLLLNGFNWNSTTDNTYILTIYETRGAVRRLILYRHAALRATSEPPPTTTLSLTSRGNIHLPTVSIESAPSTAARIESFTPPAPVQLQAQLLSNPGATLSIDLYAERPLLKATFEIRLRNHQASKPVNLERQANLTFELPENFADGETEPTVHYRLLDRDRRTILEGDLPLANLLEPDQVGVNDLQTDQPGYRPGEQVRVTLLIEGTARQGINIEIAVRDEKGQYFHRDQRQISAENHDPAPSFTFTLPATIKGPATIEYQLLDPRQGRLQDAGQRELIIREER